MTVAIDARTGYSALLNDGNDSVLFDNNGLKIESYPDGVITGAKLASDVPFRKGFTSTEQTITAAGSLSIAHGLGSAPSLIQARLICKTAEVGYSVGDEVIINPHGNDPQGSVARGLAITPNSTNINIRYASDSSVFTIFNKSTGAGSGITPANWKLVVRAFA